MVSERWDRFLLASVIFAVMLAQVMVYPGVPELVRALGATTDLDASMWFLAVEFAAFIVFAGPWGIVSDSTGKRVPFIVVGALGGAGGYAILASLPTITNVSFSVILVFRVLQGAATIGAFSLALTMLMDLSGGHGRNMGSAGIAIGLGLALGAPIGGYISGIGPLMPLYTASLLLLVVAVLVSFVTDRAPTANRLALNDIVTGLRHTPGLGVPYAFGIIDRFTAGFFSLVGTFYFRDVFELDAAGRGLMLALFFVPFAVLQYPFGVLSDRIGRTIPIVIGSMLYGLAVVGVGVATSLTEARIAMVVVGILGALMAPATMALVTDLVRDTERGVAMGGFNVFTSAGFLAGFVLGTLLVDQYNFFIAFMVAGSLEVLLAGLTLPFFLRWNQR